MEFTWPVCLSCSRMLNHPLHEHGLFSVASEKMSAGEKQLWTCSHCRHAFAALRQQDFTWACRQCNGFVLCKECVQGQMHTDHVHELYLAKSSSCYAHTSGQWVCNSCGRMSILMPGSEFMRHCPLCHFDVCDVCFNRGRLSGQAATSRSTQEQTENNHRVSRQTDRRPWSREAVSLVAIFVSFWLVDELYRRAGHSFDPGTSSRLPLWLNLRAALAVQR